MANRRMFSCTVVQSARFLKMSTEARLLYYDLGMAADDEGAVEAFSVLRMSGFDEKPLHELQEKQFVSILNSDLVTYICDWDTNNYIRKDRFTPSVYHELIIAEKQAKNEGESAEKQAGIPDVNQTSTKCQTNGVHSLGQKRSGKVSLDQSNHDDRLTGLKDLFFDFFHVGMTRTLESEINNLLAGGHTKEEIAGIIRKCSEQSPKNPNAYVKKSLSEYVKHKSESNERKSGGIFENFKV